MAKTSQTAIIVTLLGVFLIMIGLGSSALGLGASIVPPDWEVENTKTLYFAYSTDLERIYEPSGRPTSDFDFPIDQSRLPIPMPLGEHTFQIDETMQDGDSTILKMSEAGNNFVLDLVRNNRRTYPAELPDGKRLYITAAELPERPGEWVTQTGDPFFGFRSVTVSLAQKRATEGLQYAIYGLGIGLVVFGFVIGGKTGKGTSASAVIALSVVFMVGSFSFTVNSINTDSGSPTQVNLRVRDIISGDNILNTYGVSSTFPLDDGIYELSVDNVGEFGGDFYEWSDGETDNPRVVFVGDVSENTPPRPPTTYSNTGPSNDWTYTGSPDGSALFADDGDYAFGSKSRFDDWGGYSYPILPDNATISGIEVTLKDCYGEVGKVNNLRVSLSWDNLSTFTTQKITPEIVENAVPGETHILGSSSDTWGRTWTATELKNSLWARVTSAWNAGAGGTTYLDYLTITVHAAITGSFGETFEARYRFTPEPVVVPVTGAPPTQISPRDGGVVDTNDVVLDWIEVSNAWYYEIWIDKQITYQDPVVILSFPSEARVLLSNGFYYWKSRTHASVGPWSRTYTFRVSESGGLAVPLDEIPPLVSIEADRNPIVYTESQSAAEGFISQEIQMLLVALGSIVTLIGVAWMFASRRS